MKITVKFASKDAESAYPAHTEIVSIDVEDPDGVCKEHFSAPFRVGCNKRVRVLVPKQDIELLQNFAHMSVDVEAFLQKVSMFTSSIFMTA